MVLVDVFPRFDPSLSATLWVAEAGSTPPWLLDHENVATTMIYTHMLNRGPAVVRFPADRLFGGQ